MNYWFIIHKFESLLAHKDLIGFYALKDNLTGELKRDSSGKLISRREKNVVARIQIGDKFAYYCPSPKRGVVGLFEIVSDQGQFTTDWSDSLQFSTKPLTEIKYSDYIPYADLVDKLDLFIDQKGERLIGRAAGMKINGTIKSISQSDYELLEKIIHESENPIQVEPVVGSLHIEMITSSHIQAAQFQCESYIGIPERNRVISNLPELEHIVEPIDEIPTWMQEIGSNVGSLQRINYIDNIWFFEESNGFPIPFAIYEHEKDNNLRSVMDHFNAMERTLQSNKRFSDISPLYFIIAKDEAQAESYKRKIGSHGDWGEFQVNKNLYVYYFEQIQNLHPKYITTITNHLIQMSN